MLIAGISGYICNECAEQAHEIARETMRSSKKKNGKDGCATAGILISVARIVIDVISTVFVTVCGILLTVFYFAVETGLSLFIDKLFESLLSLL